MNKHEHFRETYYCKFQFSSPTDQYIKSSFRPALFPATIHRFLQMQTNIYNTGWTNKYELTDRILSVYVFLLTIYKQTFMHLMEYIRSIRGQDESACEAEMLCRQCLCIALMQTCEPVNRVKLGWSY